MLCRPPARLRSFSATTFAATSVTIPNRCCRTHPRRRFVYHLFGDAQEPGSLVLSENDLLDFLINIVSERPPLPNSLVRALKRSGQSFLFVGFGITQWYLRVLLKVLVGPSSSIEPAAGIQATEPLRGLSEVDREQTILFYQRGTRIELEDADTDAFLTELAERLDAEGGFAELSAIPARGRACSSATPVRTATLPAGCSTPCKKPTSNPGGIPMRCPAASCGTNVSATSSRDRFHAGALQPGAVPKMDSYVNKEIALARERRHVRGPFLIPLGTAKSPPRTTSLN